MKKMKGAFGLVGAISAGAGAFSSLRNARADKDKLLLANAIASIGVAVTGILLAVRSLKKKDAD